MLILFGVLILVCWHDGSEYVYVAGWSWCVGIWVLMFWHVGPGVLACWSWHVGLLILALFILMKSALIYGFIACLSVQFEGYLVQFLSHF